jgi:hypothetical protein
MALQSAFRSEKLKCMTKMGHLKTGDVSLLQNLATSPYFVEICRL